MCRERELFRHRRRVRTSLLRRSSLRSTPIRLPPFAMRPALPASDYYEGSVPRPALAEGWPTPSPESRARFPSSHRLRLRAVLGSACTPGTARCRARPSEDGGQRGHDIPAPTGLSLMNGNRDSEGSTLALPYTGGSWCDASISSSFRNHNGTLISSARSSRVTAATLSGRLQTRFRLWSPRLLP